MGFVVPSGLLILCSPVFHHFGHSVRTNPLTRTGNLLTVLMLILLAGTWQRHSVALGFGASGAVRSVMIGAAIVGGVAFVLARRLVRRMTIPRKGARQDSART